MTERKDGGPAFPTDQHFGVSSKAFNGMSLRDYFAAAALTGWIMRSMDSGTLAEDLARWAYKHADAMLAERDK